MGSPLVGASQGETTASYARRDLRETFQDASSTLATSTFNTKSITSNKVMDYIDLICATCTKPFKKYKGEYDRRIRDGATRFFCNLSCTMVAGNKSPKRHSKPPPPGSNRHALTPFRWFIARARYRKQYGLTDITPEYLRELWALQGGQCPLTGWALALPHSTMGWRDETDRHKRASLDRIDSSLGYVQGNVRFVAVIANYAKQAYSDRELVEFCEAVARVSSAGRTKTC